MEKSEFKAGDIVYHIVDKRTKLIIVEKSVTYVDYFTCRYRNTITGLFVADGFYGFELSSSQTE